MSQPPPHTPERLPTGQALMVVAALTALVFIPSILFVLMPLPGLGNWILGAVLGLACMVLLYKILSTARTGG